MKNILRRILRDDEGYSVDYTPRNRAHLKKDTRDDLMDIRQPMRFKEDLITVKNNTWENIIE